MSKDSTIPFRQNIDNILKSDACKDGLREKQSIALWHLRNPLMAVFSMG